MLHDTPTPSRLAADASVRARDLVSCRVCGRTLLIGERCTDMYTSSGEGPFHVCDLCIPRAGRYGLRAGLPDVGHEGDRKRRRGSLLRRLRGGAQHRDRSWDGGEGIEIDVERGRAPIAPRASAMPAVPGSAAVAVEQAAKAAGAGRRLRRKAVAAVVSDPVAAFTAVPVGAACVPMALAAFNQSPHARTLAGLARTLGTPRVSVLPRTPTDREIIVTVAWEIVWYQFRVMPEGIEQERGQYLSDLDHRWQRWNGVAAEDGTVRALEDSTTTTPEAVR